MRARVLAHLRLTLAVAGAVCVVLAVGQAASGSSNGRLSDRVMWAGTASKLGHWGVTGRVLGTSDVVTFTPRDAPKTLFVGAEHENFYDYAQFDPQTFGVSPDGNAVAFATRGDDAVSLRLLKGELFAINADGSGLRRLSRTEKLDESYPVFSPDGKLIAYLQNANLTHSENQVSLAVMNADGTGQRTVARARQGRSGQDPATAVISWNRDSRRVLFTTNDGVNERTLLIDLASGAKRTLSGSRAEWSPNGRELAIWYGAQVYVGTVEQIAKPGYWRTLRPRAAVERRGGKTFSVPYDFVWRPDGRIFFTALHAKEGRRDTPCYVLSDIKLASPSRTTTLARNTCGSGRLVPSPTGDEAIVVEGYENHLELYVTPTDRWKPRPANGIGNIRFSWGYNPTKRSDRM